MAILGEISCLSAAIVALPAVLLWRRARPLYEHPGTEGPEGSDAAVDGAAAAALDQESPPSTTV